MATLRWMGVSEAEVRMVEGTHEESKGRVVCVGLRQGSGLTHCYSFDPKSPCFGSGSRKKYRYKTGWEETEPTTDLPTIPFFRNVHGNTCQITVLR